MNKKQLLRRFSKAKPKTRSTLPTWHNGADVEIQLCARSLQKAAKALVEKLERENARTEWDACPVVLLYREALELHLEGLVGEGSNFLESRTDPLTLAKTHSLRWLAQIVGQIIKAVKWGRTNSSATALPALPISVPWSVNSKLWTRWRWWFVEVNRRPDGWVPQQLVPPNVVQIARKLDALLDLLDMTADGLAATWDQRAEVSDEETFHAGDNIKPTIH